MYSAVSAPADGSSSTRWSGWIRGLAMAAAAAAGLFAFVVSAPPAHAATGSVELDGITYKVLTATDAIVTDCDPTAGCGPEASIRSSVMIDGADYDVTTVAYQAFTGKGLTSIAIPDSITTTGDYAFSGNELTSVVIPDSLTAIGSHVFASNALTSVTIPDTVTAILDSAFAGNQLTSVTIGDSVKVIGAEVFDTNQLTSVTIPDSVTRIGGGAFYNNKLTSVTIGSSVTTIGGAAFNLNLLTSVTIPDSVTTIGAHAFENNRLTSIILPDGVETVGAHAFFENGLTSVTIPESITTIGVHAFDANPGLADVVFLGPPPTTFTPAGDDGSLGGGAGLTVHYRPMYAADVFAGGYTTPFWQGYRTGPDPTVTFDVGPHATPIAPQNPDYNTPASQPTDPVWTGFTFVGWFTAAVGGTAWDFATPVTEDITLYAHWRPTTPGAPIIGTAIAGDGQATVSFTPPADDGGAAITEYTVTATDQTNPGNGGQTATGTGSPITITGLTNGDTYTFTVTATNRVGVGPSSEPSNAVTPMKAAVPVVPVEPEPAALAATGSDAALPLGLAGLLLLAGFVVFGASRRRHAKTPPGV